MPRHYLGIGHDSVARFADITALVARGLGELKLLPADIAVIASIDQKREAGLVTALAGHLGVGGQFFSADELEAETPRLENPSESVYRQMGCHGVAEAAALAAAGPDAELILPKIAGAGVTCAIARRR